MESPHTSRVLTPIILSSNNERLPYDILGLIFHEYSFNPSDRIVKLETLLLVCKSWFSAALGHRTLWCRITIVIRGYSDILYWQRHVSLRLSRSSITALFDIALICPRYLSNEQIDGIWGIASDLVGREGCIAKRWRSLRLRSIPDSVFPLFCVPTPNLVDIELGNLGLQHQRLPDAPALETFSSSYSKWLYPNLQRVTHLTVKANRPEEIDAEAISKAQKLTNLTVVYNYDGCQLKGDFPVLEYLHLEDVVHEDTLSVFSAPCLKIISVAHYYRGSYSRMLKCPGIRFHALEELVLCLDSSLGGVGSGSGHHPGVRLVLQQTVNIKVLRVTSRLSLGTVLEIPDDLNVCRNHHFTLKYSNYSMALCQGEARRASVAAIRLEAGL